MKTVREVVLCKDCKFFVQLHEAEEMLGVYGICKALRGEKTASGSMIFFPHEMFCNDGKEGEETHEER